MKFDFLKTANNVGYLFNVVVNELSVSCGVAAFMFPLKTPIKLYDQHNNHVVTIKSLEEIERSKTGIVLIDKNDSLLFDIY